MTPEIEKRIKTVKAGRVPAGYKKTKVGIVPKEWEVFPLKGVSTELHDVAGKNNYEPLSISAGIGFVNQTNKFGKDISGAQYAKYTVIRKNDFSYNKGNSKKYPQGCIYRLKDREIAVVPNVFESFRLNCGEPEYFEHLFINGFFNRQLSSKINHGVRDDGLLNLRGDDFYSCQVPFPPLSEQKKIAEILSAQDKIIELKEKLIAEKQRQKKYLMRTLLDVSTKCSFQLNGVMINKKKWKSEKIGNICDTFSGGTPNRSHSEYFNGNIPWIKSGELNQENIYETEEFLTKKGFENSSAKMVYKGTLLIAMYGATAGILAVSHIDAAINQAILALVPKIEINQSFMKNAIANQIDVAVHRLVQGGQPNFNASIIENFVLNIPSLPEQQAIAAVLSSADEEISLLQSDLEQEKLKKKSLMQLLLTGLVRVK